MKNIIGLFFLLGLGLFSYSQIIDTIPNIDTECNNKVLDEWEADSISIVFKLDSIYIYGILTAYCDENPYLIREFNNDTIRLVALDHGLANCVCKYNFATSFKDNYLDEYYLQIGYSSYTSWAPFYYFDTTILRNNLNNKIIKNFDQVSIYPNPAKEFINVDFENENYEDIKIVIRDLFAKKRSIYRINNLNNKFKINLNNYNKGIYLIEISSNKNRMIKKLIIL